MERTVEPMYRLVLQRTVSSVHNKPVYRPIPYVPRIVSYHITVEVTQKERSRSLMPKHVGAIV
jgi:hypothetical protein